MKLASGFCIPEPLPVHTGIKGRQVHPLIRFLLRSYVFCLRMMDTIVVFSVWAADTLKLLSWMTHASVVGV